MPETNLNVVLIPHDIILGDKQRNLDLIESRILNPGEKVDLIVLPELAFTGFTSDKELMKNLAEDDDGECISRIKKWAEKTDAAIWGGFLGKNSEGALLNRGFMVSPGEEPLFYNKRHLFCSGSESHIFAPGECQAPVVNFRTWKLKMSICYDIRFPVWNRNVNLEYDALIVPSNWPNSRFYPWKHILIARAIENQAYVIGCDREGVDEYGVYVRGDSMILDYWGKPVSSCDTDGTVRATLYADALKRDRARFSPWKDNDSFTISY